MIRPEAKLSAKALAPDVPKKATRDGYGAGVVLAAERHPELVVLSADVTESTRNLEFKKKFPERFIQVGVHEQFLTASAAGLALAGKMPFINAYATFCPGRSWEQIRTNICINDVNVKIMGHHTGISVGADGATHQATEDIALMRVLANMTVVVPCDAVEARKATLAVADRPGPCYVRLTRESTPVFTTDETPFEIGKALTLREGPDVALVACGHLVHAALVAAEELAQEGIEAAVIDCHTVKPLDEGAIEQAARKCGAIVSIEEHQVIGGLGGAVSECLARRTPVPMEFVGIQDRFGESGGAAELLARYGLDKEAIKKAARQAIKRKK